MTRTVDQITGTFLAALDEAGVGPFAAVLHGSAARGQFIAGWSDINLVLVFDQLPAPTLARLAEPLRAWRKEARTLPLLVTAEEWRRSADSYPLEIAEMRWSYRVLRGPDPLAGLSVHLRDLRPALERELRGKLLRLRQGYATLADRPGELGRFIRDSVPAILFLLRCLLILTGAEPPADPGALVAAAAAAAGFDPAGIGAVVGQRSNPRWKPVPGVIEGYLVAVADAARFVDHYQTGETA